VSVERTLGTVVGGLIGLGVVQLGDMLGPFLSATDTAFTSARRAPRARGPCLACIPAPLHLCMFASARWPPHARAPCLACI